MIDWKLFNIATNREVKIGDRLSMINEIFEVVSFEPPHKPDASGKIVVKLITTEFKVEPRTIFCTAFNCEFRAHRLSKDG